VTKNLAATNVLCLMSRTDYDKISDEKREDIQPFYDSFQDAVKSIRMISENDQTTIEIMVENVLVSEINKLLWYGIHDLVSPGNISYIEVHNFDYYGNTIDIEKYLVEDIVMSVVKHSEDCSNQSIQITGVISKEITIADSIG